MYICFYVFISPWKKAGAFIWTTWNLLTQKCIEPSLVENWPSSSGEKHFSHFVKVFYYFVLISSWKRAGPAFEQPWILFTQRFFVLSLVKIGQVVLEKQIFYFLSQYFCFFIIISTWKRAQPFIWANLNSHNSGMLCDKFVRNGPGGSGDLKIIVNVYFLFRQCIFTISLLSSLKKMVPLIWRNLKTLHLRMHCAKFGGIGPVVLEKKIVLHCVNVFSLIRKYIHLEKGGAFHLNKLVFPSPKHALFQVWLKLVQWFWRRRWKCEEKFTSTSTTTTTDNGQIVIRKAHSSLRFQ